MRFSRVIWALTYPKHRSFVAACRDPETATARLWEETKMELRNGPFWRGRVRECLADYPVTDYEDYRAALEGAWADKQSPLTGRDILFWSESGGTTGKSKIYPITEAFRKSFQSTTPPFLHALAERFPGFLSEPVLYFASTLPSERSPAGIEKGFISGYNYRNVPALLKKKYAFPLEVFRDRDTFFRWGPLYALATDLSAMIAITPSMLEQFARETERHFDSYLPCLEGRETPPGLPPVHCPPGRLARLRETMRKRPFSFREVWPSLEFVCCWKTGTCGWQLPRLAPWLGDVPVVDATYSATEGWITVPLSSEQNGGPVHPRALICEFLDAHGKILQAWELRPGENYEILLTTKMGFVRYRLYDVVRCTGFFHRSPVLEFVEKAGNAVSLGHTRVSETHVLEAILEVELAGPWILAPAPDGSGLLLHHRDPQADLAGKLDEIERGLRAANAEYAEDIRDGLLKPLRAAPLPAEHPLWNGAGHAQTKPKVIQQKPAQ